MIRQLKRRYPGPGGMFALSFLVHLVVFAIIWKSQSLTNFNLPEEPVTYVDLMALPVASPQSGTPAPAAPSAPPAPAQPKAPPEMALPAPKAKSKAAKAQPEKPAPAKNAKAPEKAKTDENQEFNERMAKLERQAEERRQAEVLDRLRKGMGGRVGMPGAKGTEAGSDYASYVQSRLKDAFRDVMAAQTKSPQVIATIVIGSDGRIAEYRVDKASGDPIFDDAVARAVTLAGRSLKPPPGGGQFKRVFRFRPEGVGVR